MKIPVDKMKLILRPSVNILENIFKKHNYEIRVVGGAVRDLLREKTPTDLDFATPATPIEMTRIFNGEGVRILKYKNWEKHGTIIAHINDESLSCSTLRNYKIKDGTHAEIEFINDWKLDGNRRDLTINSMFLGLDGTLYDYFNGAEHLKKRKIQFVDNPDDRIKEDPFRIIRYFRFFGMLTDDPYNHDPEVIASIIRNCDGLDRVSIEKIMNEFRKILKGKYNYEMFSKMIECGLGHHIGLPHEFDYENVAKIYKNIKDTDYHYSLLLAAGMRNEEEVTSYVDHVKCTIKEREILEFVVEWRILFNNIESLKELKGNLSDFVYLRRKGRKNTLELCKQLLLYVGKKDLLNEVNDNLIPRFPISEEYLVDKVEKKKYLRKDRRKLYDLWKKSDYILSKDELICKL